MFYVNSGCFLNLVNWCSFCVIIYENIDTMKLKR